MKRCAFLSQSHRIGERCLIVLGTAIAFAASFSIGAAAQTFSVIHTFSGTDGAFPQAGMSIDGRGRLYGTTSSGGVTGSECAQTGCGTLFRLAPEGNSWVLTPLHAFTGPNDGATPISKPVFGPNGLLYGTTNAGGAQFCEGTGCGMAYSARPGATACVSALCSWQETLLYSFGGVEAICDGISSGAGPHPPKPASDLILGSCPGVGELTFDQSGNMYGTVPCCYGSVYELSPNGTATALYYFTGGNDGSDPEAGVIFDHAGNLYGTTVSGGTVGAGTVYDLSNNGSGWTKTTLYNFQGRADGDGPYGGLVFDAAGNLYGTTNGGGAHNGGTVYELTPSGGGNWTFHLLTALPYNSSLDFLLYGPTGSLVIDSAGNLYGTTVLDGAFGGGNVFKLTPSGGSWTYTSLHDFTGGSDGDQPFGSVVLDANGNIYGTTSTGGTQNCQNFNCGVVWEITP